MQRIFSAGVMLGDALASEAGTVTAVEDAIGRLDEAVIAIRLVIKHASLKETALRAES